MQSKWSTANVTNTSDTLVHTDELLPQSMDFHLYGNMTTNGVINAVVNALDDGPDGLGVQATAALALSIPIILLLCAGFMRQCRRKICCGGACVCFWYDCDGCCRNACGNQNLLNGTNPATGLQPDEEVDDPDVIIGDEGHVHVDPRLSPVLSGSSRKPPLSSSDTSDDERGDDSESSYQQNQKRCCDTVAACLENGDAGQPVVEASARNPKQSGRGKKK